MTPEHSIPPFTEDEIDRLCEAVARSGYPFTEADLKTVYRWAVLQRVGMGMVTLALQGRLGLYVTPEGEVAAVPLDEEEG